MNAEELSASWLLPAAAEFLETFTGVAGVSEAVSPVGAVALTVNGPAMAASGVDSPSWLGRTGESSAAALGDGIARPSFAMELGLSEDAEGLRVDMCVTLTGAGAVVLGLMESVTAPAVEATS